MARRGGGKKRGIQRGVQKHKVTGKSLVKKNLSLILKLGIVEETYCGLGQKCFYIIYKACVRLQLSPMRQTASGRFVTINETPEKVKHYLAWAVAFLMLCHRLVGTLWILMYEPLKIETFMCISHFLIYFVACGIGFTMLVKPDETADLLNSWFALLACLREIQPTGSPLRTPFDDLSASLKVICALLVAQIIAFYAMLLSLVFSTLPTCYLPLLEYVGLIPQNNPLPRWAWQILLAPLEYVTYLPPMFAAPFVGSMMLLTFGVVKVYARGLRKLNVTDINSRVQLERLYHNMEIVNKIICIFFRFMLPPTIFSGSVGIIIAGFVSIRYTEELPLFCYCGFPCVALTMLIVVFWTAYDAVVSIRESEAIMGQLLCPDVEYLRGLSREERMKVLKRAKAMRVIEYPVGDFTDDVSLTLPVNIWEEIVNQILFLLSY